MISIEAKDVHLTYKVRSKLELRMPDRQARVSNQTIQHSGRHNLVRALNGISFCAGPGDRIGLVGKNGAGKTTLLKVLYGIFEPTAGNVIRQGKADALFNINLGFRREATGRRNIVLRGLINGWTIEEIEAKTEEIVEFSEIGEFIDLPIKSYSQGMAARLAFSVATAMNPEILIMDEWIGAGDPSFQEKARNRMSELTQNAGIIILASHNMTLMRRTCTHILELDAGTMKQFVPAKQYFETRQDTI